LGVDKHDPKQGEKFKKADELYRKALGIDPDEDETIQERIRDLKVVVLKM